MHGRMPLFPQRACQPGSHTTSHAWPRAPARARSETPFQLLRDAVACLLSLVQGCKSNMRLALSHEDPHVNEPENMAQRLFGRLLRDCGDFVTQAGPASRMLPRWRAARAAACARGCAAGTATAPSARAHRPAPPPLLAPQRDLLEVLYRCARQGRPELHARFMPEPAVAAAFDELLEKDGKVAAGGGLLGLVVGLLPRARQGGAARQTLQRRATPPPPAPGN